MCVVLIKTFWLDVRYPQQAEVLDIPEACVVECGTKYNH